MAKFCTKCGKPLEEGKVCDCAQTVIQPTMVATNNGVNINNNINPNNNINSSNNVNTNIDIKESFMDCLDVFKNILTKPFDAIKNFVCENKYIAGIIMIVLAAISSGLYRIATLKSMYNSTSADSFNVNDFSSLLESALSGNLTTAEPEYLKEFFTSFATNLAEYALIVLIGYLIISKLLKSNTTWKHMITAVAISVSIIIIGNIINSGLVFIDGDFIGNVRGYIASFASISSILILGTTVTEVTGINKNKVFISVASMSVLANVVIDIAQKLFA